jgi:lipoyl(octanoyl) transferase
MDPLLEPALLRVRYLGRLQAYEPVWLAMQAFTQARSERTSDELWVLQHRPVFTLGQAGRIEHVLNPGTIPLVKSDRGGQVTYHGPGQLVIYTLLDIGRLNLGSRALVSRIEQAIVDLLAHYGILAAANPDAPGVYVDGCKIASLGLRIRNGRAYHGLSLNVDMDLEPFQRINPCGHAGMQMVQLADFEQVESMDQVAARLVQILRQSFGHSDQIVEYSDEL